MYRTTIIIHFLILSFLNSLFAEPVDSNVAKKVAFAEVIGAYEEGSSSESAPAAESAAPAEGSGTEETQTEESEPEEQYDAAQDSEEF